MFSCIKLEERPSYFKKLHYAITALRKAAGHPNFIIIDESHHLLPMANTVSFNDFPDDFTNIIVITTQPGLLCIDLLKRINIVLIMGELPLKLISSFTAITGDEIIIPEHKAFENKDVLVWQKVTKMVSIINSNEPGHFLLRISVNMPVEICIPTAFILQAPFTT